MKTTLVALAALMITAGAHAQEAIGMNGVSLRLGLAFPLDNTLSGINDNFTSVALEFANPSSLAKGTDNYLAIDYFSKSFGTFGKGSVIPITYNMRIYQNKDAVRQTYAFFGLGIAINDLTGPTDTVFAARGGFGMNVSDHTFVEAAGTFTPSSNSNGSFNTIGFYVGYRF
ncbi:MAG: hypothetical protein GC165_01665 [Armatimonadetes bacterium]|nr:hypothetical protein [Armatimonadota bacterium]